MWRWIFIIICSGLAASCGASDSWTPRYHGALSTTSWKALTPRPRTSLFDPPLSRPFEGCEPRKKMVEGALELYEQAAVGDDFGQKDLERLLDEAEIRAGWTASRGIASLVSTAKRRDALEHEGDIRPGDIVLFHNVADHNGNGLNDDWLGAVGVAVARDGELVEAVVRTKNAPRKVVLSPGGPRARTLDNRVVNSYLRIPSRDDPPQTDYLAGRLYAGHIDLDSFFGQGCKKR